MASSSSSSTNGTGIYATTAIRLDPFTPIEENDKEEEEIDEPPRRSNFSSSISTSSKLHSTPVQASVNTPSRKPVPPANDTHLVSCNRCRPSVKEKNSVVPINGNSNKSSTNSSPNPNIFKSMFNSLTKKSPQPSEPVHREDQYKLSVAELSQKLLHATGKRDEAILEASRLKSEMSQLELKFDKLEKYCHSLKSGLDVYNSSPYRLFHPIKPKHLGNESAINSFPKAVSDSRVSVRRMSHSMMAHLRILGGKAFDRLSSLLVQLYDVNFASVKTPKSLILYLEAILNRILYEDFETIGFERNGTYRILNPVNLCGSNYESYLFLVNLTWEEVLNKGTKHFSEDFSRFCDRKMNEIVTVLGWSRTWSESVLQSFFGAAKGAWLVHLLAWSMHPSLPILRVERGAKFDGIYMEDITGGNGRRSPTIPEVKVMVAPGFYVFDNVVRCKVLCGSLHHQQVQKVAL